MDWKGNPSGLSTALGVTTPPQAPIFSDGFESGDLSNWDTVMGLTVESANALDGTYSAESIGDGSANTVVRVEDAPLDAAEPLLRAHFKIVSTDTTNRAFT